MKIIKMPVAGLNPEDLNLAAKRLLNSFAINTTDFPAAPVADLTTNQAALNTQNNELDALVAEVTSKRLEIADTCGRVRSAMNQLGEWAESVTHDPGKLGKVAPLRAGRTPAGPLPHVTKLKITHPDAPGVIVPRWASLYRAGVKSYEVQTLLTGDPLTGAWVHQASVLKAKCTLPGLPTGARVWVRVRGIGTSGPGDWSTPVSGIVT